MNTPSRQPPNLRITGNTLYYNLIVLKAEGLHKRSFFHQPDPFAVLMVDGEQTVTSPVVKSTVSPFWNFSADL